MIKIANPIEGGKQYTSAKRALHFIRSGRAELTTDGQLFFFTADTIVRRRRDAAEDADLKRYRSGVLFWNGSDPNPYAQHRPGEMRS